MRFYRLVWVEVCVGWCCELCDMAELGTEVLRLTERLE